MNAPAPAFDILTAKRGRHGNRPLVGTSAIERMFLRHVQFASPEARLCVGVIRQAFVDLCGPSHEARRDARRFFRDGRLEAWCDLLDLSPEFVREVALKTGYLPELPQGGSRA
jgi:hypothetical protein